jgi:nucleotide-binding universal stress UspA family protein
MYRRKDQTMPIHHVLVPTDFSASAEQALDYAIRLARTCNARLTLLHVIQPVPMGGVDMGVALPEAYLQEVEEAAQGSLEEALARVTAAGLTAEQVVLYGVPFQEIVETAKARQVDLIVMGTQGRTGFMHVLLGSVAEHVVRLAPCSVLVVRG